MTDTANLVPTIESTVLPSTPTNEWATDTNDVLNAHTKPATPLEMPGPPIPGSFPDEPAPERSDATIVDTAKAHIPAEDQVQRAMTNAGQAAKAYLPQSVAAYFPSSTSSASLDSDLAPPRPPFAAGEGSRLSNLSTEAQAGSMLSDPSTPREGDRDSANISMMVHTGASGSPHPVAPLSDSLPSTPMSLPNPNSDSKFVENLVTPPTVASPDPVSLSSASAAGFVSSPDPMSSSSVSGDGFISSSEASEGIPAPPNSKATTLDYSDMSAGPDVVPPSAPHGVIAPGSAVLNSSALKDNVPSGVEGTVPSGVENESEDDEGADYATNTGKKPKLVQRLKEKLHVGHTSA
ncbi:hypothetical protein B0H16DRAFT_444648 [Mycena metata]|uniref:Uncharacterized protein n=1 Tax=Mycena metata TaxID=1033252 RepID=A0AAD7JI97_9AGAR|nr:hypothetical protein B0H16DRAFT_444648 [Mycena metata]